ncbi:hypothetical protein CISIN_1g0006551mg, partial [Citrus sinensis]
MFLLN